MKSASERLAEADALDQLEAVSEQLGLKRDTQLLAKELYLMEVPLPERSREAVLASSCYTAGLLTGQERSQGAVAKAFGVSRHAIQGRWRDQLTQLGLTPPEW